MVECRRQGTVEYDDAERAARCCGLVGFETHRWRPDPGRLLQIHMGAPPRYDLEGSDAVRWPQGASWQRPHEDPEESSCPGSWYRCSFVEGLLPFRRRPTEGGGRCENTRLARCDDRLVHEWISLLEGFEDAEHGEYLLKVAGP